MFEHIHTNTRAQNYLLHCACEYIIQVHLFVRISIVSTWFTMFLPCRLIVCLSDRWCKMDQKKIMRAPFGQHLNGIKMESQIELTWYRAYSYVCFLCFTIATIIACISAAHIPPLSLALSLLLNLFNIRSNVVKSLLYILKPPTCF